MGEIIPEDITVTLTASAGKFIGADQDNDAPGFQVIAHGGKFTAMQSSLSAQRVEIRAAIDASSPTPKEAYTDVEFITNLRSSLATGSVNLRI